MNRYIVIAGFRLDTDLWITLGRGVLAITLGLMLMIGPGWPVDVLGNFIGGFWIGVGIISIRWGIAEHRSRTLTVATGAAAIAAGILTYSRVILKYWLPEPWIFGILGAVAVVTGVLHMTGQITVSRVQERNTTRFRVLLGGFEIGLGIIIFLRGRGPLLHDVMAVWALIGGIILLGDAVYMYGQDKLIVQDGEAQETEEEKSRGIAGGDHA